MVAQYVLQAIAGNSTGQMMDVVDADICREPSQDTRQLIVRAAVQRSVVKIPGLVVGPVRVLELVLDVEQPDTNRRRQNNDRQMHKQERPIADQLDHRDDENREGDVRAHRAQPGFPAATHHPDRQSVLQDEQIWGTGAKHHEGMSIQTI